MKTPIKTKNTFYSAAAINEIVPKDRKISSSLFFSGQIELELAFLNREIDITTNKWVVYEFWDCMRKDPYVIADMADGLHKDLNPQLVYIFQQDWPKFKDPNFRSALFFLLNRYSADGTISHGRFNTDQYSRLSSRSMINFCETHNMAELNIKHFNKEDWTEYIPELKNDVLLLPIGDYAVGPLNSKALVGFETYKVNHRTLESVLHDTVGDFILVYKYNPHVLRRYKKYRPIMIDATGQKTLNHRAAEDIIITNMEIR